MVDELFALRKALAEDVAESKQQVAYFYPHLEEALDLFQSRKTNPNFNEVLYLSTLQTKLEYYRGLRDISHHVEEAQKKFDEMAALLEKAFIYLSPVEQDSE